ncbi:kinase-like protein [Xylona heveae TC161]|uniref:non-specific serine/threonine protein kinase n=1 Tax=Xylona heveae (strain CBS 132557 / TC161) TaxID=1328760 RepID=A0A165GQ66_XYLHT|nr:kinase-like protein [Xylona heveae TC161]KZF22461.1 kinase-like protein [Xylona heveae TC161]
MQPPMDATEALLRRVQRPLSTEFETRSSDNLSYLHHTSTLSENLDLYRPGGYHPVSLGDTFKNGRYRVAHKLGWGGFSIVWVARDNLPEEWVALKIHTAETTLRSHELSTLQSMQQHGASPYIVRLLDSFDHIGPNGSHQCLVFELLGPSVNHILADYNEEGVRLEIETILKLTKQLLQAISFLHRQGYAHGDISGNNVVFTASELKYLSEEALCDIIGHPQLGSISRNDGTPLGPSMPKYLVERAEWDEWIDDDEADLRLIDWGEAFKHGAEPPKLAQPFDLKAPETIFTDNFDYRLDLWRAGCVVRFAFF